MTSSSPTDESFSIYGTFHGHVIKEVAIMNEQSNHVLVVEDNEAVRDMLALSLKQAGYHVEKASDGVEALGEMKQRRFDVVVTDYRMPCMNGLQFLSLSKVFWPNTPVVMVSGEESDEIADVAMRQGAFTWLHKPYERSLLLQILRMAIQQSSHDQPSFVAPHSTHEAQRG
jgi:DNA-binding NtrC family response regulator